VAAGHDHVRPRSAPADHPPDAAVSRAAGRRLRPAGVGALADGGLTFLVAEGDAFIVKLLTAADRPALEGISVRRPTLDDVFLSLTGRQIRAEGAEGNAARLRALVRRR